MLIKRAIIGLIVVTTFTGLSSLFQTAPSTALAATSLEENALARDAATSRDDINLTNSCIEAGKSKSHCLCVTKVFKHEMSLREYKAATKLYQSMVSPEPSARSATKMTLKQLGYNDYEITNVDNLQHNLSAKANLKNRCEIADAFFNQNLN